MKGFNLKYSAYGIGFIPFEIKYTYLKLRKNIPIVFRLMFLSFKRYGFIEGEEHEVVYCLLGLKIRFYNPNKNCLLSLYILFFIIRVFVNPNKTFTLTIIKPWGIKL